MDARERSRIEAARLLRLLSRLHRWAATTVQAGGEGQDLSLRQLAVLYLIREGVVFPGELARKLRVAPAVVTGLLDRLEQRGYLRRLADPDDRRRLRLALTEAGMDASLAVERMLSEEIAAQLDQAPALQLEALEQALNLLEQAIVRLERRAPRLGPVPLDDEEPWEASARDDETVVAAMAAG
ncbi:MAG: MarR family transcriptional regulator [Thermomicrobiales bacterium]